MTKGNLLCLIKDNPDAEILVFCGEESYCDEYGYTYYGRLVC